MALQITLKWLVTCIQNRRKLPHLTLCNASQIIEKVVLYTYQMNKVLCYVKFAWFVLLLQWIEWGLCRPSFIVMTALLSTICFQRWATVTLKISTLPLSIFANYSSGAIAPATEQNSSELSILKKTWSEISVIEQLRYTTCLFHNVRT